MTARVLIADDAPPMRRVLRAMLEEEGLEVVGEACDGAEAVEAFARLRPDVVTLDVSMPGHSGLDAVRGIRSLDPAARIVVCSARGLEMLVMQALQAGAVDYIVKPLHPGCVRQTLRAALGLER